VSPTSAEEGRAERLRALAAEAEPNLTGPDRAMWIDRLEREYDGLRTAFSGLLDRGKGEEALRLAADLWVFQETQGHAAEAREWLAKALASPGAAPRTMSRARALYGLGILAFRNLDQETARRSFEECQSIATEQGSVGLIVRSCTGMARLALRRGDTREVRKWSEEGLAIARERGDRVDASSPLHLLAAAARVEGDHQRARAFYRENLALNRELGRLDTVSVELGNLGALEVLDGNIVEAVPLLRESLRIAHERRDRYGVVYQLVWLGRVALAEQDPVRAATLFAAARAEFDASGLAMDPDEAPEYERGLAAIRGALDDQSFGAAWAKGQRMSLDDAVGFALRSP
jgi:tetratricopeptide (TPR) repeat protein